MARTNLPGLIAFLVLSLFVQSPKVFALQESGANIEDEFLRQKYIQEVTVTAFRVPQESSELALSISSLNEDDLETTAHIHIQESINRLPGVNMHRNNGQEYLAAVRSPVLTGAGSCGSLLAAEDGLPLRPTGFCNVNELFEAHTEAAESIEVIRGPGTALFGSRAMHGVINVRNPASFPGSPLLSIEAGAYDFGRLKLSGANEDIAAAMTLTTDGGYRDDSGYDQQKLSVRHRAEIESIRLNTGFTATHLDQETAGFLVGTDAYRDRSLARTNPNPEAFRTAKSMRVSTIIESVDQNVDWTIRPYARYSQMDFLQHFLPGQPLEENGHYSAGVLSRWGDRLSDTLQLITGLDLEYADSWLRQSQDAETQGSAFLQATVPLGSHYDYQVRSFVIGPYAHLNWQMTDKLELGLGARLERVRYRYDNQLLDGRTREDGTACGFGGCRYSRPADRSDSFTELSPKFSLRYQFTEKASGYLNISNGFRAPEIAELYRLQRNQTVADLDSERMSSIELGARYSGASFSAEIAAFRMEKSDVILRDVDFFNVSDGETNHQGIELQMGWQFSKSWSLDVAATYAQHEYANNPGLSRSNIIGNDIDTAPRHFGSARLTHQFSENSGIELEWQHMGRYFTDPENLHAYEGHDLLHLRALWEWNKNWRGSIRLNNLLDDRYAERADFTGFTGDRYFPGQSRRVYLGLSYQL